MSELSDLASVIETSFSDENLEENVVDAINRLARAIRDLGNADAATPMGGMEALGVSMNEAADKIARGLETVAVAIDQLTEEVNRGRQI